MNLTQIAQIMVFDLIDVSFCVLFVLLPFRECLCSRKKFVLLAAILYTMVVASRILSLTGDLPIQTISAIRIALYVLIHKMAVQSTQPKRLFVMLVVLNYVSFVMILFHFLSAAIFPAEYSRNPYSITFSLLMTAIFALFSPFIYWLLDIKIRPLMNLAENTNMWNYIWLIPATFCIIFHYNVLENNGVMEYSRQWYNVVFSAVINAGSLLVTYMIIKLVDESNANLNLKTENYQLVMQAKQYENLKSRMEETRLARHDLRHSITVVKSYLDSESYEELKDYVGQYSASLSLDAPIIYCENYAINAVIAYYDKIAREHGYEFKIEIHYPLPLAVSDIDATVLLGNLLENAMEACDRQTDGRRYIHIRLKQEKAAIIIAVDNTYSGTIKACNGGFISSKNGYTGTGAVSIKKIAEKYHGLAKFEYEDGMFYASVMLNP